MAMSCVLIANRGEIACRVIRTARSEGLRTVAVYSEADAEAPHVAVADEAVLIGAGPVGDSYLRSDKILDAARRTGADAIHPGYGFLSENADFVREVVAAGLIFIGPSAEAIEAMGDKAAAKTLMIAAGVPCVPGYQGEDQSTDGLIAKAQEIGMPVMIKASAGGGGRGMRLVEHADNLADAITLARAEAQNAFGSGDLIIEKAIRYPRHVEIQIFADAQGNTIHLGERDCSVQRRHQKVIEEAPCPVMTPDLRARMGKAAVDVARAVSYQGAGTVEFLLDDSGAFYFLEMNTRLQVEHPVTELVTGLDLVALQLSVAAGDPLPVTQEDISLTGHAIELRLYAEDPANDYLPATGQIDLWRPADGPGVRVDAGVSTGLEVSPFYDAMLAKIIVWGDTRAVAHARAQRAVRETVLLGVKTNTTFLANVLDLAEFKEGKATTDLLGATFPGGYEEDEINNADLALAAALILHMDQEHAFARAGYLSRDLLGWSSAAPPPAILTLLDGDTEHEVSATRRGPNWDLIVSGDSISVFLKMSGPNTVRATVSGRVVECVFIVSGNRIELGVGARRLSLRRSVPGSDSQSIANSGRITAAMPGLVQKILVRKSQSVVKDQPLAVLEAMKMQHQLKAPFDGTVMSVQVSSGQQVAAGDVLIELADATVDTKEKG